MTASVDDQDRGRVAKVFEAHEDLVAVDFWRPGKKPMRRRQLVPADDVARLMFKLFRGRWQARAHRVEPGRGRVIVGEVKKVDGSLTYWPTYRPASWTRVDRPAMPG